MSVRPAGRHRVGQDGLRHCREHPGVAARLDGHLRRTSHAAPRRTNIRTVHVVGAAAATGAALMGGWLATTTNALADILSR